MEAHVHPSLSLLQLDRYFIKKLAFSLNEGFDRRGKPTLKEIRAAVIPETGIGIFAEQNPDNDCQWRIELVVDVTEDKAFPYKVAATVVGYFSVNKRMPKEEAENLAKVSGASILYTTTREIIVNVTGRTQYPHLMLPTVTFLDLPELLEEEPKRLKAAPKRLTAKKKARAKASSPAAKKK